MPPLLGDDAALRRFDGELVGHEPVAVKDVPRIGLAPAVEGALFAAEVVPGAQVGDGVAVLVERGGDHRRVEVHRSGAFAPAEQGVGHEVFDVVFIALALGDVAHAPDGVHGRDVLRRIHDLQAARDELGNFEHICGGVLDLVHVVARRRRIAEGEVAAETRLIARGDGRAVHGGAGIRDVRRDDDARLRKIGRHLQRARLRLSALPLYLVRLHPPSVDVEGLVEVAVDDDALVGNDARARHVGDVFLRLARQTVVVFGPVHEILALRAARKGNAHYDGSRPQQCARTHPLLVHASPPSACVVPNLPTSATSMMFAHSCSSGTSTVKRMAFTLARLANSA